MFGGVQTIALTSGVPLTLTVPAGFTATPTGGPTQAQNAVLRFTGVLVSTTTVTLPIPGYYIIDNQTSGAPLVLRAAIATQIIGIDQGMCQQVYNDGSNVKFVNLGATGQMEFWTGYTSMPGWITNCTVAPYLLCDGSTFAFSTYPALGARYGGNFGGNGVTTAATPDMRGRVPLAYDGTGTRITAAVSGINGQTLGAAADNQGITLTAGQIPSITSSTGGAVTVAAIGGATGIPIAPSAGNISTGLANGVGGSFAAPASTSGSWGAVNSLSTSGAVGSSSTNTGGQVHSNVQPAQVAGIWVVRAA